MTGFTTTEHAVAKKTAEPSPPSTEPPFERIEFQAPIGFGKRLDAARKRRALSRSAFIRQAVLALIERFERDK